MHSTKSCKMLVGVVFLLMFGSVWARGAYHGAKSGVLVFPRRFLCFRRDRSPVTFQILLWLSTTIAVLSFVGAVYLVLVALV